jgi:hypothetical protein
MKKWKAFMAVCCVMAAVTLGPFTLHSEENAPPETVQVHVVVTDAALRTDQDLPPLKLEDVTVKQGKKPVKVTQVIHAGGETGAIQLMILIDDTMNTQGGNLIQEIKSFVGSLPPGSTVGVGYMANATFSIAQNFTNDRDQAMKAVRLPLGKLSTQDSPFLSLISLIKSWPPQNVRRIVLMVSDGIDRLRGEQPTRAQLGPQFGWASGPPTYHSMPTLSTDATSASELAQRYNVVVFPLYAIGVGRAGRSQWDLQIGLSNLTKIADETGGECFALSTSQPVSFEPYLEQFKKMLANQYYIVFQAIPDKKAGFQRIRIDTEAPNSEILAPDNVWVPALPK